MNIDKLDFEVSPITAQGESILKDNCDINEKYDKEIQFWDDMIISHPEMVIMQSHI